MSKQMQEDLFNRQLWEEAAYVNAISWSEKTGILAFMTKSSVQTHCYQHEYMASFQARWLTITKSTIENSYIDATKVESVDTIGPAEWLSATAVAEKTVEIKMIHWSKYIFSTQNLSPVLIVLLTDGTLLILDTIYESVPSTTEAAGRHLDIGNGLMLKLRGMSVLLNGRTAFSQYIHSWTDRIRCFTEHKFRLKQCTVLIAASYNCTSLWRVLYENGESNAQINDTGHSEPLELKFMSDFKLTSLGASDSITSLLVLPSHLFDDNSTDTEHMYMLCTTDVGTLHCIQFTLEALNDTVTVTGRKVLSLRIGKTPIYSIHYMADRDSRNDKTAAVCVTTGAIVRTISVSSLREAISHSLQSSVTPAGATAAPALSIAAHLLHKSNISSLITLPTVHSSSDTSSSEGGSSITSSDSVCMRVLTASLSGELAAWTVSSSTTAAAVSHQWARVQAVPSQSCAYPVLGATADPTGLLCAYLYKTPANHANSREVQLNNSLKTPRSALCWLPSIFVDSDFAINSFKIAEILIYIINTMIENRDSGNAERTGMSLIGLPLLFLNSLEVDAVKKFYRSKIVINTATGGTTADAAADWNDVTGKMEESTNPPTAATAATTTATSTEEQQEYDDFDLDDSDSSHSEPEENKSNKPKRKKEAEATTTTTTPAKKRALNFTSSSKQKKSYMDAVSEKVREFERPDTVEAVGLMLPTLFDAVVIVLLSLATAGLEDRTGALGVNSSLCDVLVQDMMDPDEKIAVLFEMPDLLDTLALERRVVVWQCLHLLLLALHRLRGAPAISAEYEHLPASLRQILHVAYSIRALQRYVAFHKDKSVPSTTANTSSSSISGSTVDSQSVYYMCAVLQHYSSSTNAHTASQLTELTAAVQTLLYAKLIHTTTSSSAVSVQDTLQAEYHSELCDICGDPVEFQPHCDDCCDTAYIHGSIRKRERVQAGSVMHSQCRNCTISIERCCFSLRLVTTSAKKCGISTQNTIQLYMCPVCDCSTNLSLVRTVSAPYSALRCSSVQSVLCPYCSVLMLPR